jgi:hypothetical protein
LGGVGVKGADDISNDPALNGLRFREQITGSLSWERWTGWTEGSLEHVMPDYRICSITEDNHIASTPLTIVCDDDQTAIQRSQKLLDRNDVQLWQGRRLVTRLKAKRVA